MIPVNFVAGLAIAAFILVIFIILLVFPDFKEKAKP